MTTTTDTEWQLLDDENVDVEGYVIINTHSKGYIAPSRTELFKTEAEAKEALSTLVARGLPIGLAEVVPAKLKHARQLAVKNAAQPKLIITK